MFIHSPNDGFLKSKYLGFARKTGIPYNSFNGRNSEEYFSDKLPASKLKSMFYKEKNRKKFLEEMKIRSDLGDVIAYTDALFNFAISE